MTANFTLHSYKQKVFVTQDKLLLTNKSMQRPNSKHEKVFRLSTQRTKNGTDVRQTALDVSNNTDTSIATNCCTRLRRYTEAHNVLTRICKSFV